MAKQSNLENLANEERQREFVKSPYVYSETDPYSAEHPDALADGDAKGKGTGESLSHLNIPEKKGTHATATMMGITVNTTDKAGGLYDVEGTQGVQGAFQGDAGRKYLLYGGMNLYNPENEYGQESVDTSSNIPGQFWVK